MTEMLEIRWHGRGGQGAKTAALLLGEAATAAGKYVQAFPEYGPERMGAPVTAYNRISDEPIKLHCGITNPKFVVALDPTFVGTINLTRGLMSGGALLVNTSGNPAQIRNRLGLDSNGVQVFTLDANTISQETIGRTIPNTPMLGALVKVSGILGLDDLLNDTRSKLEKKFRHKPEVIEGNMKAIERAYAEVIAG